MTWVGGSVPAPSDEAPRRSSMRVWFENKWEDLRTSFWFIPTVMVLGSILLSFATIQLDKATPAKNWVATFGWTFTRGPEGSRAVLSTVAGSMMTIASVTFSITVVALQLASSQFGPRLLRNFMRDKGHQVSIGTFIATFTYCLLVLRTVNGTENETFVPHISVTVGLLLAMLSLGVFIYFIHHSASSIQAENVISGVSRELNRAIGRLYPQPAGHEWPASSRGAAGLPAGFERNSKGLASACSNDLQAIDLDSLLHLAEARDVVIEVLGRPGKFFFEGEGLARVWPADRVDDDLAGDIRGHFYFVHRRTSTQDVEFSVAQLVEVAVRALSPGINDPTTAMSCVDRLGASICTLTGRSIPSPERHDDQGHLRILAASSTASGIVDACFNQIRQAARKDTSVTMRLLETIAVVARLSKDPQVLGALRRPAEAIRRGAQGGLDDPSDLADAEERYREAAEALDLNSEGGPIR